SGTTTVTYQVTDAHSQTANASLNFVIAEPLSLAGGGNVHVILGQATSKVLTPSGGLAPYTTTLQSGALPNGVSWSSSNGTVTIAGTPSALGT
ncbi:hypothetical protein ABTF08_19635, partial [Acinetobacter baumannii]